MTGWWWVYGQSEKERSRTAKSRARMVGREGKKEDSYTMRGGICARASCGIDMRSLSRNLVALGELEREEILARNGRIRDGGRGMEEPEDGSSGQVDSVKKFSHEHWRYGKLLSLGREERKLRGRDSS